MTGLVCRVALLAGMGHTIPLVHAFEAVVLGGSALEAHTIENPVRITLIAESQAFPLTGEYHTMFATDEA